MNTNMDENDFRRILGEELDTRIEPLATREELDTRIEPLATREELDTRIEPLATREELGSIITNTIAPLLTRLNAIDQGFNAIDELIHAIDQRFNAIDELIHEVKETNELQVRLVNLIEKVFVVNETLGKVISQSIETSKRSIRTNEEAISNLESRLDDLIAA